MQRTSIEDQALFQRPNSAWKRNLDPPPSLRPVLSLKYEYVNNDAMKKPVAHTCWFDSTIVVLAKHEGLTLGLESTWQLVAALRKQVSLAKEEETEDVEAFVD